MALTSDRHTTRRDGVENTDPVAADTTIHAGALVVLDASGNAEPGSAATGLTARGVAGEPADNAGGQAGEGCEATARGGDHRIVHVDIVFLFFVAVIALVVALVHRHVYVERLGKLGRLLHGTQQGRCAEGVFWGDGHGRALARVDQDGGAHEVVLR